MFREHLFDDGRTDERMDGRRTDGRKTNPTVAVRIAEGGARGGREPPLGSSIFVLSYPRKRLRRYGK